MEGDRPVIYRDDDGRLRCREHRHFRADADDAGEALAWEHLKLDHEQLAELAEQAEVMPGPRNRAERRRLERQLEQQRRRAERS